MRPSITRLILLVTSLCMLLSLRLLSRASAMSTAATTAAKAVVFSAPQKHTATLVFLHGLGDSADGGWSDVMPQFQAKYPFLKVVLPNAPVRPVTLNGGMKMQAWYDIEKFNNADKEKFNGLDASRQTIDALLTEEIASGTPSARIVLGGFSQGAAVSLFTGLQFPHRLGGILSMSGYLPVPPALVGKLPETINKENKETPILLVHGESDPVIRLDLCKRSHESIGQARGEGNLVLKTYKGMGHSSSEAELRDVLEWLGKLLA